MLTIAGLGLLFGACATGSADDETTGSAAGGSAPGCPAEFIMCDGSCTDPSTDKVHCGGCDLPCDEGVVCSDGICDVPTCDDGKVDCDGTCVDPDTDPNYCGTSESCTGGLTCEDDEVCVDGGCVLDCPPEQMACGDSCIDPLTDPNFCGATADCAGANAGTICAGPTSSCAGAVGEMCDMGACTPGCATGTQTFAATGAKELFALPSCVAEIQVKAWGAQGGSSTSGSPGGLGAYVEGIVCVPASSQLELAVGEQALGAEYACGGGGGTFVALDGAPLLVAGGGGGGYNTWVAGGAATLLATAGLGIGGQLYNDGGGGGGFTDNGFGTAGSGGISFINGAGGGFVFPLNNMNCTAGAFGGGGGASQSGSFNAGGGGGYDGGSAGNGNASTGGTSFISVEASDTMFVGATASGDGSIEIIW